MAIIYNRAPQPSKAAPVSFVPQQLVDSLPVGFLLPLTCVNNRWQMLGGLNKIEQNMYTTLTTPIGRTLMLPTFGSLLPMMIMEPINAATEKAMSKTVRDALAKWCKLINVISVTIDDTLQDANVVLINISYTINKTTPQQRLTLGYADPASTSGGTGLFVVNQTS